MKCSHLVLFLFLSFLSQGQDIQKQFDDLLEVFEQGDFDQAHQLADTLAKQALELNDLSLEVQIRTIQGISRVRLSMPSTETINLLEKPIENVSLIDENLTADFLWALGSSYFKSGKYYFDHKKDHFKISDSLLHTSLSMFEIEGNTHGVFRSYWSLGAMKAYDDDLTTAINYYRSAYEIALEYKFPEIVSIVNGIGVLHNDANRWEDTIEIISELLDNEDRPEENWRYCYPYVTIGEAYFNLENWSEAAQSFKKAIQLVTDEKGKVARMYSYDFLSYSYIQLEKYDSAAYWVTKAEEYVNDPDSRTIQYLYRTKAYLAIQEGAFELAEQYSDLHLKQAIEDEWNHKVNDDNRLRYVLYKEWGQLEKALSYYEKHIAYEDSIRESAFVKKFEDYKVELETAKQRANILELEKDIQEKNARLIIISVVFILMLVIAVFIVQRYRSSRKIAMLDLKNQELENKKIKEELLHQERQLSDFTVSMMKKNQVISELDEQLSEAIKAKNGNLSKSLKKMQRHISMERNSEESWEQFLKYFGAVHSDFFEKLNKQFEGLSRKELKHCALIKMNMSLKESANIFGISPESVKVARYRLRKKINIEESTTLYEYLSTI